MLCLKRNHGQAVIFHVGGEKIVVQVFQSGNRTTLGITAPDHVRIVREELELRQLAVAEAALAYLSECPHEAI
jgi:sRNA-binding carbon storage regulator CsrA